MSYIFTPYVILCAFAALIAMGASYLAWLKRSMPGGLVLSFLMMGVSLWSIGVAFEFAAVEIPMKIMWSKIQYIGINLCPPLFLIFALAYNRYYHFLKKRYIIPLMIIPAIILALAMTNEWHGLIWNSYTPSPNNDNLLIYGHGAAFWIGVVGYSYALLLIATVLFIGALFRFPSAYRFQNLLMVMAIAVPWVGNLMYISGLNPIPGLELTAVFMGFSGTLLTWNLYHLQLLDLVPLARDLLIETMPDGMLVLDGKNRVVDINPIAQSLLNIPEKNHLGKPIQKMVENHETFQEFIARLNTYNHSKFDFSLENHNKNFLELSVSPIHIPHRSFTGKLIVVRDITKRKLAEEEIRQTNEVLRLQLEKIESLQQSLHEQAVRDSLTGLFNRRYLDETLEREFARAQRDKIPLSIGMLDLDHFKYFNDTHGHIAGDAMLQHLGQLLNSHTRLGDITCRYGGEEFVIVIPDIPVNMAYQRVEQLRKLFEKKPALYLGQTYYSTFSSGIAAFPEHGSSVKDVLYAADQALYRAKSTGRNRVVMAEKNGTRTSDDIQ